MANVRQIQVAKLKYYYAVPMFDFVETVNHVYVYTEYKFSVTRERVEYVWKGQKIRWFWSWVSDAFLTEQVEEEEEWDKKVVKMLNEILILEMTRYDDGFRQL